MPIANREFRLFLSKSAVSDKILKRYAPAKYTGDRIVGQPFHSQRILSDMIEVGEDADVKYNPFIKLSPLKRLYSGITDKFNLENAKNMNTDYINMSGVNELRDYYTKAKAAETAAKPAINKP